MKVFERNLLAARFCTGVWHHFRRWKQKLRQQKDAKVELMDLLHFSSSYAFYCLLLITDVLTVLTTWNCHLRLRGTASSGFSQLILKKHLLKFINAVFCFLSSHLVLFCALKLVENNRRELFLGDRWSFLRQARDLVQLAKVFIQLTCIDVVLRRVSKSFCERLIY